MLFGKILKLKVLDMKIKILVPIYNDWQSLDKLLEDIDLKISNLKHEFSVIIVNDASTHDRREDQKNFENINSIKISKHEN